MLRIIKEKLQRIVKPISQNEDEARSEFILNILLCSTIVFSIITFLIDVIEVLLLGLTKHISILGTALPLLFFFFLYFLSRKGFYRIASYCLLGIFFFLATYELYAYGADLPPAILSYVLIIVMAGILINTRFAFITTATTSVSLICISYLQRHAIIRMNSYWKQNPLDRADFIVFIIIFCIIATVSWLSNREIERSLIRARRSEADLKRERDSLEITVEEKTRELREAQAEKIDQLYRFAEFGRLSSGLFHDLINPLHAVSINIEQMKNDTGSNMSEAKETIERAINATRKMEDLVATVRKQITREENSDLFSPHEEIVQVIQILAHKSHRANVIIDFTSHTKTNLFGDATKFHYAVLNLVSNAIDACEGVRRSKSPSILISLSEEQRTVILTITDHGCGITSEHIQKIFEPFFTTKGKGTGIGIGLSMTKRIIEKDFGGTLSVKSKAGRGSEFTARIPTKSSLN